jgi:hypothetical protein
MAESYAYMRVISESTALSLNGRITPGRNAAIRNPSSVRSDTFIRCRLSAVARRRTSYLRRKPCSWTKLKGGTVGPVHQKLTSPAAYAFVHPQPLS